MSKDVAEILRTASDLGWTAMKGGKDHWKLVPPGGLSADTPRPLILPSSPSDRRWRQNWLSDARRYSSDGTALADVAAGKAPREERPAAEVTYIEPSEARKSTASETMEMGVEAIDPQKAATYLATTYEGQRKIREGTVTEYALDMASGRWAVSNDAISFDREGRLINGQHRLAAVVRSGATITAVVMRGMSTEAYEAMDTGKKRGLADLLGARGYASTHALSSALYALYSLVSSGIPTARGTKGLGSVRRMLELAEHNPGLVDAVRESEAVYDRFRFSRGIVASLFHLFKLVDEGAYKEFRETLISGKTVNDAATDPAIHLRETLINRLAVTRERRLSTEYYAAVVVKAWNAYARGDAMRQLKWGRGEGFPQINDPEGRLLGVLAGAGPVPEKVPVAAS